ncbi:MAG: Unknown protein, partial [uncultured Aureispira sp.]
NDGTTVNLAPYLDNTDNQRSDVFQLVGNNLQLSLSNDGVATQSVDLSGFLDADNLGNHTATTNLNMSSNTITNVQTVSSLATASYDKLRVWNSANYTIGMNSAMTFGYLGDYAMTFTMNADNDRGWIWRDVNDAKSDGAASLTTDGRFTVKSILRSQGTLLVDGNATISSLSGAGTRMVVASPTGLLSTQAITVGDITGVTAGTGLTGGGTTGNVTVNVVATNGLNTTANDIRLGGALIQATTITQGTNNMTFNLNSTGDFHIQDNGVNHFSVGDNGSSSFGGDVQWRDENTGGTVLAELFDDGNDGRFVIRENGLIAIDLDVNTQFIFNEQGYDRNFRIESDANSNMLFLDAGQNRLSVGTSTSTGTFNVQGNSYHSDDIYLRDGSVSAGDILIRMYDSADDGVLDLYQNNAMNHRIHGNGVTVFNEQGLNVADLRMESDLNTNMFYLNSGTNRLSIGTNLAGGTFNVQGNSYHSDDIYLRDGAVSTGDVLVRIYDSSDDGIIDVYQNNVMNHRIHGNGITVFNEQGLNVADLRMESDLNANMLYLNSGTNRLSIGTNLAGGTFNVQGNSYHSDDIYLRDGAVSTGDVLVRIYDSSDDGIIDVYENNAMNHRIHGNGITVFNEQGLNIADLRMESDGNANMLYLNSGTNQLSVGTNLAGGTFNVLGNSYHSDDIYLRDGAVNTGDVLVRIHDSADDGIIDVYENNGINHRIHGNGVTVFNEQGNNNADIRMESDLRTNMFFLDASTNHIGINTAAPTAVFHVTADGTAIGDAIKLTSSANNGQDWYTYMNANDDMIIRDDASDVMCFQNATNRIGINTNAPTANLSVSGTANKTGGGTWAAFSDRRLKKDIIPYTDGLTELLQINPVKFKYIGEFAMEENPEKEFIGVIAQEVKEIAPYMVETVIYQPEVSTEADPNNEDSTPNYKTTEGLTAGQDLFSYDASALNYMLINAVKEQQAMIDKLGKELEAVKAQLNK